MTSLSRICLTWEPTGVLWCRRRVRRSVQSLPAGWQAPTESQTNEKKCPLDDIVILHNQSSSYTKLSSFVRSVSGKWASLITGLKKNNLEFIFGETRSYFMEKMFPSFLSDDKICRRWITKRLLMLAEAMPASLLLFPSSKMFNCNNKNLHKERYLSRGLLIKTKGSITTEWNGTESWELLSSLWKLQPNTSSIKTVSKLYMLDTFTLFAKLG